MPELRTSTAADHPCLWGSRPKAFTLGDSFSVGWIGEDYKKNRAASVRMNRTCVELSVIEGTFSDEEIQGIFHGLSPAVASASETISQYSFASLSYWARYRPPLIVVPYGLFHYRDPDPMLPYTWSSDPATLSRIPQAETW